MSEETKTEAITEEENAEVANDETPQAASPKKKKKWPIVTGILAVVLVAAGAGFWVWHEQPSFCNAICHTPMDEYVVQYDQEYGVAGFDKWGNEVENTSSMLAVSHKEENGDTCLSCHVPTIGEQVSEGLHWITGNYIYPLEERNSENLTEARGIPRDEFCLNEACHNYDRATLKIATDEMFDRNPHTPQHGELQCTDCHKAHRASVNTCTGCHTDAPVPEGWLTVDQERALS